MRAALIITTEPVFAAVFAWTLGGEKIIPIAMLGGVIMVAGMIMSEVKLSTKYKVQSTK